MPLRLKLAISYLLIGLIPVVVMAFTVYQQAGGALREQSLNALEAVANIKQKQLLNDWQSRHNQVSTLASNLGTNYEGLDSNALLTTANYDRPIYENFISTFGYSDLKLVTPEGKVIFSTNAKDKGQALLEIPEIASLRGAATVRHQRYADQSANRETLTVPHQPGDCRRRAGRHAPAGTATGANERTDAGPPGSGGKRRDLSGRH